MRHIGDRFLVERMGERPLVEMILGLTRDPQFGLALVIGAGGILVELFQDSQTLLFPVLRHEVETALASLKIAPLLNGYRGQAGADKAALVEAIMNLARLAEDFADVLVEVDINPLFVYGGGVLAVDGVVRMVKGET
jgi:acyl-CoA synthetase (NDP forming)